VVGRLSLEDVRSLLEAPSPAVLTTHRPDRTCLVSPVWYRWTGESFEIVVVEGDVKLRHLERDPRCALVVFEAVPPFRGVEVQAAAEVLPEDVTDARRSIAGRYLGRERGVAFALDRKDKPGVLVRLRPEHPRVWDLSSILPA
jgi:PPOX class probable F420-dependent enzyme